MADFWLIHESDDKHITGDSRYFFTEGGILVTVDHDGRRNHWAPGSWVRLEDEMPSIERWSG